MLGTNFESVEALADYIQYLTEQADDLAKRAKTQRDKNAYEHEAGAYRYMEQVVRTSNLIRGRLVLVDEDLEEARKDVEYAIERLTDVRSLLGTAIDDLNEKLSELVPEDNKE